MGATRAGSQVIGGRRRGQSDLGSSRANLAHRWRPWDVSPMVLRARHGPALLVGSILALLLVCFGARPARAWVDVHVEGDDVRLSVDRSGRARVEHRVTLKISG